jgi:hypothetical protein
LAQLEQQAVAVEAAPKSIADAAAIIAALRESVAGTVKGAESVEGVRARLSLLFERFEIERVPDDPLSKAQAAEYGGELGLLGVGGWVVVLVPREDSTWAGDIDGYWEQILTPLPLPKNEQSGTVADY